VASIALALTTTSDSRTAESLARTLVGDGLAACATIIPAARSIYRWKGAIEDAAETVILLKTTSARLPMLRRRLRALHGYELPEDLALAATAGLAYRTWINASTAEPRRARARGAGRMRRAPG
jgi:periplasmic divalent cation tolerance protein